MINEAIEKLNDEKINFKGDRYRKVMLEDVHKVLVSFCEQEEEFAQAIVQSDKTLSDCLEAVAGGITNGGISDLDAYKRAVRFYFNGADIECTMKINLIGSAAADTPPIEMSGDAEPPKVKTVFELSLDDLL